MVSLLDPLHGPISRPRIAAGSPPYSLVPSPSNIYIGCGIYFSLKVRNILKAAHSCLFIWNLSGIPFLFRVGLALICCSRRSLLESTREEAVLGHLFHVPPVSLPPTTEAFISLVYSMKMKDDDIRKQRIKMEAQVKRQTQMQTRVVSTLGPSGSSRPMTSISLPRN
jgi:hypothetical protein